MAERICLLTGNEANKGGLKMKIRDLLQLPFFRRNCIFVPAFPCKEEDILSTEDEIEDIKEFVTVNEPFEIESEKSSTGYFLVPNCITYVICKVK